MPLRDLHSADDRVEQTDDPAELLALAQAIRSRFADNAEAEAVVRRALVKWVRVRRELGREPVAAPSTLPLAATLLEELRDARTVEQLLEITARIRQYHARGASGGQEPVRRGREGEGGPVRSTTPPRSHEGVASPAG